MEEHIRAARQLTVDELHNLCPQVSQTILHETISEGVQKIVLVLGAKNINGWP